MALWLWRRPVVAVPIQPLARELPYAAGTAAKKKKKERKERKEKKNVSLSSKVDSCLVCACFPSLMLFYIFF